MTSTELASLLLKEADEYLDSSTLYLKEFDKAFSLGLDHVCSQALCKAKECSNIARALRDAARLLIK